MKSIGSWEIWATFSAFILLMLIIDSLLLGSKKLHRISIQEALCWTLASVGFALLFNFLLWGYLFHTHDIHLANQKALEFFTGYLIEKSLSVDNLFIFFLFFNYLAIPAEYQHRVLSFGILGAIGLRLLMILLGVWMVTHFHWILYIFGLLLLFAGGKMLIFANRESDLAQNPLLRWLSQHLRISPELQHEKFFIRKNKVLYATPLFLALILIEISDVIFALDSIPAIFAITEDPFIVFTSNVFAILGLRALYFVLANTINRFRLLHYGLALILIFIGSKMLIADWIKIPTGITLGAIILTLSSCVFLSFRKNDGQP